MLSSVCPLSLGLSLWQEVFGDIAHFSFLSRNIFRKNVCLSWISSDGSICCEGREYQWAGRALFAKKNFFEGNPITQFQFKERYAVCLRLMANMKYKHCHEQKPLILKKFDILYISPKSNFFYEDIPVWGKHAWYQCLRQQKTKSSSSQNSKTAFEVNKAEKMNNKLLKADKISEV